MAKGVIRFYDPDAENGYLSNWYRADFVYAGRTYHSGEQYMMLQKALTFGDTEIAEQIMATDDLREIKQLGRRVAHYNDSLWKTIRMQIMRRGLRAKFQQNPQLLYDLLATGNALIAECAPRDLVWGIGIDAEDSRSADPKEWKGRNLLGRTLMRVREDLRAWCAVAGVSVTAYVDAVDLRAPQPVRVGRRSDNVEAERIRRELLQSMEESGASVSEEGVSDSVVTPAITGVRNGTSEETTSVWNMRIYEAVMLPYLSEIASTWMEEVFFNLRRSRSYEDLGVSNYTFEELEWMLRSGQSAGLPQAGFFEMKQDIFDMIRYQGGLRNPAALLAQLDLQEISLEELSVSAAEEIPEEDFEPEEHITVTFRPRDTEERLEPVLDPGVTSSPETYLQNLPGLVTEDAGSEYAPEEGEEAKTSIGSVPVEHKTIAELWESLRELAGDDESFDADETFVLSENVEFTAVPSEDKPSDEAPAEEIIEAAAEAPVEKAAEVAAENAPAEEVVPAAEVVEAAAEAVAEEPVKKAAEAAQEKPVKAAAVETKAEEKPAKAAVVETKAEEKPAKAADVEPKAEEKSAAKPAAAEAVKAAAKAPEGAKEAAKPAEKPAAKQAKAPSAAEESMFSHKNKPVREEDDEDSKPAAKPAEKPAAKAPEKPAEVKKDAAKPAEKAPQKPAEPKKEAAKPAEKAPQKPAEPKKEAAKPAEKAPEKPAEPKKEAVKPAEKAPQKPAEPKKEAAKPAETEPQKPAEVKKEAAKPKEAAAAAKAPAAKPRTYRDDVRSEIVIKHGNIVTLSCDAIVNGTNQTLLGGPGIDNTILKAGGPELLRECAALKGCDVGRAKISRGYRLKAQFVIHTVGPKYSGDDSDPVYLTMCYENCLNLAMKYDLHSVAFPPISTGYFGYPLREAAMIASRTVQSWMRRHPEYSIKVIFVSADERTFAMYREILSGKK